MPIWSYSFGLRCTKDDIPSFIRKDSLASSVPNGLRASGCAPCNLGANIERRRDVRR